MSWNSGDPFLNSVRHTNTPIGIVAILNFSAPMPPGWERLRYEEAQMFLNQLKEILDEWSIVAFAQGKMAGSGYHYKIDQSYGNECGEGFILKRGNQY